MPWTKRQSEAIEHEGGDVLVAAGAGAGKTGVLTERVVRKVVQAGWSVTDLLVVTFTDAAAAEMRRRIAAKLNAALDTARARSEASAGRRLANQVVLLDAGQICTLHSFAGQLIREHFHHLGLDPAFEILDPDEATLVQQEVLDDLLDRCYRDGQARGQRFQAMLDQAGAADGDGWLRQAILRLDAKINSLRSPSDWWRNTEQSLAAERVRSLAGSAWGPALRRMFELEFEAISGQLTRAEALVARGGAGGLTAYAKPVAALAEHLADLRRALAGPAFWTDLEAALACEPVGRMPSVKNDVPDKAPCKALLDAVRDDLRTLRRLTQRSERDLLADLAGLEPTAGLLAELCRDYRQAYTAFKASRGQLDFNDLERLALCLLEEFPDVRAAVAGQFREVLVDEYQDISPVQNAILYAATGRPLPPGEHTGAREHTLPPVDARGANALFMVGDLKQSIYRFRLAEPDIFADTMAAFTAGRGGHMVPLADNFRSRRSVIDTVNAVFRQLMQPVRTLIDVGTLPPYDTNAELRFAAPAYADAAAPPDTPIELHLLEWRAAGSSAGATDLPSSDDDTPDAPDSPRDRCFDDAEQVERQRLQARWVGWRIGQLLGHDGSPPATVWDDAARRFRPARPRDVVILLRTASRVAQAFAEELAALGLPVHATQPGGYFEAVEVADVRALLAIIDNPRQDIPLAAVLRSPLMTLADSDPLTADELATIRLADAEGQYWDAVLAATKIGDGLAGRLRRFVDRISAWRTMARRRPLSELLADIFRVTGYLDYVAGLAGGPQRRANLLHLAGRARQFDRFARQGLARFARFLDELEQGGENLGIPNALSEADDVVRVMTIHASKGLEFPIVILADLEHEFNLHDCGDDVLFHRHLLLGLRCADAVRRIRYASLPHALISRQMRLEMLLEEVRLGYVAMTRARDRLILVASEKTLRDRLADSWLTPLDATAITSVGRAIDWLAPAMLRAVAPGSGPGQPAAPILTWVNAGSDARATITGSPVCVELYGEGWLKQTLAAEADRSASARPDWQQRAIRGESFTGLATLPDNHDAPDGTADPATVHADLVGRLSFAYPHAALSGEPAKRSVSELKHLFETRTEDDEQIGESAIPDGTQREANGAPIAQRTGTLVPPWEQPADTDARARGLATHAVLQRLDLAGPLDSPDQIAAQIERMRQSRLLEPHQPGLVDVDAIAAFFASPMGKRLRSNPAAARREWPFALAVPVAEWLPPAGAGELVLVQGIVDVLFSEPDGSLTVLDFKTDAIRKPADLADRADRYRSQLQWYARAAETILGQPVRRRVLYFLAVNKAIDL